MKYLIRIKLDEKCYQEKPRLLELSKSISNISHSPEVINQIMFSVKTFEFLPRGNFFTVQIGPQPFDIFRLEILYYDQEYSDRKRRIEKLTMYTKLSETILPIEEEKVVSFLKENQV